jgi:surfactin synthase thioesterase subunit
VGEVNRDLSMYVVRVPTLVIWGEQDKYLLTSNLEGLEQFVPVLTIKRVPDGSHWVIHEQPQVINRLIREFVEQQYQILLNSRCCSWRKPPLAAAGVGGAPQALFTR